MTFAESYLRDAHKHCANHRAEVEASIMCGCFHCRETFAPSEIVDWVDDVDGTAVCARCMIDSVIGDASGFPVQAPDFLAAMNDFWFERTVMVDPQGNIVPDPKSNSFLARMRGWLNQKTA